MGKKTGGQGGERVYRLQEAYGEWGMGIGQEQMRIEILLILGP